MPYTVYIEFPSCHTVYIKDPIKIEIKDNINNLRKQIAFYKIYKKNIEMINKIKIFRKKFACFSNLLL